MCIVYHKNLELYVIRSLTEPQADVYRSTGTYFAAGNVPIWEHTFFSSFQYNISLLLLCNYILLPTNIIFIIICLKSSIECIAGIKVKGKLAGKYEFLEKNGICVHINKIKFMASQL